MHEHLEAAMDEMTGAMAMFSKPNSPLARCVSELQAGVIELQAERDLLAGIVTEVAAQSPWDWPAAVAWKAKQ